MTNSRKDNPSSIFYWKDYENDEGLRISSLAAQGLWMRLLCVAAKAEPYGYVLVNGLDIGVSGAAKLGSISEAEAAELLSELERNGVFSRDRRGRPFSRRMVKDAVTRKKNAKNGKKGGNPALTASAGKDKENKGSLNPQDNTPDKPPYPLPHTLKKERGGGGSAHALDAEDLGPEDGPPETPPPTPRQLFRERILAAIPGADPVSGMTGPTSRLGTVSDMHAAAGWTSPEGLGLTEDEAVAVIADVMATKHDGPPSSFAFFAKPMARFAGLKTTPPPTATIHQLPTQEVIHVVTSRSAAAEARLFRLLSAAAEGTTDADGDQG